MTNRKEPLEVYFYRTVSGNEPVKEWLRSLPKEDMKTIGSDIKTVQFGYPIGMPLTRVLHGTKGLEEVRSNISNGIARVIFMLKIIQLSYYMDLLKNLKAHRKMNWILLLKDIKTAIYANDKITLFPKYFAIFSIVFKVIEVF